MTVSLEVVAQIRGTISKTVDDRSVSSEISERAIVNFAEGTGINQANRTYTVDFNIAASGSLNVDLSGALVDDLGQTAVFTAIKAIYVKADAANANNVVIGNGTAPFIGPFSAGTETIAVKPGGVFLTADGSAAGWPVTAATADILKLANSGAGTAVTGTLVIVGEI